MEQRRLGTGGLRVGAIGLGCMSITHGYTRPEDIDEAEGIATIQRALDRGVTLLDTAEVYGPFTNEVVVGKAINLRGREALGQVEPSDYGAFCTDLCATLEAWPPVAKAWRREELYEGPYVSEAPDIILELALEDGYSHACLRSRGGPCFRRIGPAERLGGKERGMNGSHRPTGVLFLSEPSLARRASLFDVAPTVLARLGVQGPPLEGVDLFRQDALPHSGDVFSDVEMPPAPYSEEEERIIEERLRALGYLE